MSNFQMEKLDLTKIEEEDDDEGDYGAPYALFNARDRNMFASAVRAAKARRRVREHAERVKATEEKQTEEIAGLELQIKEMQAQLDQYAKGDVVKLAVAGLTKELEAVTNQYNTLQRGVREPNAAGKELRKIVDAQARALQSIDNMAQMIRDRVCI